MKYSYVGDFNKAFMINFSCRLSVKVEVIMNKNVNKSICFGREENEYSVFFIRFISLCVRRSRNERTKIKKKIK